MPSPCRALGLSPNKTTAPSKVKSGALARTGEASEMGRCLSAKKVKTQDRVTSAALATTKACSRQESAAMKTP
jgi:hypothetical protein